MDEGPSLIPVLAFGFLDKYIKNYQENNSFSTEDLESLYSFFGSVFLKATEYLGYCKIYEYEAENEFRRIYKVGTSKEQYTVYDDINFCFCPFFKHQVLEARNFLTCKHFLAVRLGKVLGKIRKESLSNTQYAEILNQQLNYIEE